MLRNYNDEERFAVSPNYKFPNDIEVVSSSDNVRYAGLDDNARRVKFDYAGGVKIMISDIKNIIQFGLEFLNAIFLTILEIFLSLIKLLFFFFIIWLFWYLTILFWPWVIELALVVAIPILNVIIMLTNFFLMLAIIILSILIVIWNMIVPFLGMILYLVINVFVTTLAEIFNVIGAIDWEPIISAFMSILMPIVDVCMQILLALIQLGIELIQALANVSGIMTEIIMTNVKILVEVLGWIFKLLFVILEPILKIIGAFFGAITGIFGGRKLLSVEPEPITSTKSPGSHREYWQFVEITLGDDYRRDPENDDIISDALYDHISEKANTTASSVFFGRKPLEYKKLKLPSTNKLTFVDEDESLDEDETKPGQFSNMDDVSHTIAHTMFSESRKMAKSDVELAFLTLNRINKENADKSALNMKSILKEYRAKYYDIQPKPGQTLAAVRFGATPEHPQEMSERFHRERERIQYKYRGRTLLETDSKKWSEDEERYLSEIRIKHARDIIEQERIYKEHHFHRMKVATVIYTSSSKAMKETFEYGITPSNLIKHTNNIINRVGYNDVWHLYHDFKEKHGDPSTFIVKMTASMADTAAFKFLKRRSVDKDKNVFFHDWATQKLKMQNEGFSYAPGTGRFLLQLARNGDKNVEGSDSSSESLGSLPMLSTLDCTGELRNPFCIPEIPPETSITIPTIELSEKTKQKLRKDVDYCKPWKNTLAIISLDTLYNVYQEFRFLLSAIPFINYPIATLTVLMPWTNIFFNWMFMVPKFHTARIFQWLCFIRHLYDVYIVCVLLYLISIPLKRFIPVFVRFFRNIISTRLNSNPTKQEERSKRKVESMYSRMQRKQDLEQDNIGGNMNSTSTVNNIHIYNNGDTRVTYKDIRQLLLTLNNEIDISAIGSHTLEGDIITDVDTRLIQHNMNDSDIESDTDDDIDLYE